MEAEEIIKQIDHIQYELKLIKEQLIQKETYSVYCHLFPNNRYYIGVTKNTKKRWLNGRGYKSNTELYNAIQKYGWSNIQHLILFSSEHSGYANIVEQILIGMFEATKKDYGYNKSVSIHYPKCKRIENIELELLEQLKPFKTLQVDFSKLEPLEKAYKTIREGAKI